MTRRKDAWILFWSACPFLPIMQHLPFFEESKFVECNVSTGTWWSFCENQSMCGICILIGECCNRVESLDVWAYCLERLNVMNDWDVWNALGRSCSWDAWNAFGRSCRMIESTLRSLSLLSVEFVFLYRYPCSMQDWRILVDLFV